MRDSGRVSAINRFGFTEVRRKAHERFAEHLKELEKTRRKK
jgi:hypothetical protein